MLIRQLRELEDDKIITRCVYPVVPPKVEYELSEIGHQLENVVTAICDWGDDFSDFVDEAAHEKRESVSTSKRVKHVTWFCVPKVAKHPNSDN